MPDEDPNKTATVVEEVVSTPEDSVSLPETTTEETVETTEEAPAEPKLVGNEMFKRYASDEAELEEMGISFTALKNRQHRKGDQPTVKPEENKDKVVIPSAPQTAPQQPRVDKTAGRDYSGIDETDIPYFKKMGNETFDRLKPIYVAHKQAEERETTLKQQLEEIQKTGVPKSYYQHPKAYTLSDKYNQIAQRAALSQAIQDHWAEQLVRIRRGEEFVDLTTDANGNIAKTQPRAATNEDEVAVMRYLTHAQHQAVQADQTKRQFEDNWGQSVQKDIQFIKSVEDQYFPGFSDAKHPTAQIQKTIIESLPEAQRDNILAPLLAKTGASNVLFQNELKKLQEENKRLKAQLGLKEKQQPQPRVAANGSVSNTISYERMRNRNRG